MSKRITLEDGSGYMLMTDWLRTTLNPVAPNYPKIGDVIKLKRDYSFFLKANTPYTVEIVEEFEPAYSPDQDGRDIRISFVEVQHKLLNGKQIKERL